MVLVQTGAPIGGLPNAPTFSELRKCGHIKVTQGEFVCVAMVSEQMRPGIAMAGFNYPGPTANSVRHAKLGPGNRAGPRVQILLRECRAVEELTLRVGRIGHELGCFIYVAWSRHGIMSRMIDLSSMGSNASRAASATERSGHGFGVVV
jgi:hypothetical protein